MNEGQIVEIQHTVYMYELSMELKINIVAMLLAEAGITSNINFNPDMAVQIPENTDEALTEFFNLKTYLDELVRTKYVEKCEVQGLGQALYLRIFCK